MRCRLLDRTILMVTTLVISLAITTTAALAEDTGESLFAEAKALLKAGKTAEACDRFDASLAKFQVGGVAKLTVAAMLNLADCREQNQQLVTAWSLFLETATVAQNESLRTVATEARKRAGLLQPRLSYLTIVIADDNRVEGLAITRNGVAIESAMWNQGVPVDGGSYVVTATAPGNSEWSSTAEVPTEGGKATIEIPRLKAIEQLAPPPRPQVDVAEIERDAGDPPARGSFTALHWAGIGTAAIGVVALGGGVYFGLQAGKIADEAAGWNVFDAPRFAEGEAAERNSIIALSAGAACVITGGVLVYLGYRSNGRAAERRVSIAPAPVPQGVGLAAVGRF